MSITETQASVAVQGNGDPVTLAYGSNVTSGNWGVVCVAVYNQEIATPTDTLTTAYSLILKVNGASGRPVISMYYGKFSAGGANTVSVNPAASSDVSIVLFELTGADTTDAKDDTNGAGTNGTGTAIDTGNLAATTEADGLLLGIMGHESAEQTLTKGADFVEEHKDITVDRQPFHVESRGFGGGLADATVDSANWTAGGSVAWAAVAASFKPAIVAGGILLRHPGMEGMGRHLAMTGGLNA